MKKIALSILTISTLFFVACNDKTTTKPNENVTPPVDTTSAPYYVSASYNGVAKKFTNLTVYRDETPGSISLLILANNIGTNKSIIEFNFKKPATGWSDTSTFILNMETAGSYVKYTNESGKVYSTINTSIDATPLVVKFSQLQYLKGGNIIATMSGTLAIDTDTTLVRLTDGKLKLISDN